MMINRMKKPLSNSENEIFVGDSLGQLQQIADKSVNCCITSPPYFALRDYGVQPHQWPEVTYSILGVEIHVPAMEACLGLEENYLHYIGHLISIFREVNRVLKKDGTLWMNLGDSYAGSGKGVGDNYTGRYKQGTHPGSRTTTTRTRNVSKTIKAKDLIGIPWAVAFALRDDGWYLRQDIIWYKRNPMPESVTDRCTKAHEYIFLLSKSPKYYFDAAAIKTIVMDTTVKRMAQQVEQQNGSERVPGKHNGAMKAVGPGRKPRPGVDSRGGNQASTTGIKAYSHRGTGDQKLTGHSGNFDAEGNLIGDGMANKKSVWDVTTQPFKEAHFATFPPDLIVDCVKAGCPEGGVVLDPFGGAFTTAVVSEKLNRRWKVIEINPKYVQIGQNRLQQEIGMFNKYVVHRSVEAGEPAC